jgi:putative DNA primase/helicase
MAHKNENPAPVPGPGQKELLREATAECHNPLKNATFSRGGILESLASIRAEIERHGLAPGDLTPDGLLHRCPTNDRPQALNGWIICWPDGRGAMCGDWRAGWSRYVSGNGAGTLTQADRERIEAARVSARQARAADHQAAAERARSIYERARPASPDHHYLIKKGIKPLPGLRQSGKLLVVPVQDEAGRIVSLQFIGPDGQKRFLKGGRTGGGLFAVKGGETLAICEGMATGASIHQTTGWTVLCAFNCGNLKCVAKIARTRYPDRRIIICGDHDTETPGNPGRTAARDAARAVSGLVALPDTGGKPCDWNDYAQAHGLEATRAALEQAQEPGQEQLPPEQAQMPAKGHKLVLRPVSLQELLTLDFPPRENLLDPWLPSQGLVMAYAPRGLGKTFFAGGVAYACCTGGQYLGWRAPRPNGVLYIDGEMPGAVMQERFAAFVASSPLEPQAPFILLTPDLQEEGMPRLDTADGQEAIEGILTPEIKLIIVDNISTLTCTKENEADGWTPIQAWALRQRSRGRSVLFIHHSGKAGQQRGTSRREDVLDTVLSLRRPVDYQPDQGAVFEIHYEKARGLYGDDVQPIEARLTTAPDGTMEWTTRAVEACTFERVVSLLNEGMNQKDIAQELGLNKSTVSRHARKAKREGLLTATEGGEK